MSKAPRDGGHRALRIDHGRSSRRNGGERDVGRGGFTVGELVPFRRPVGGVDPGFHDVGEWRALLGQCRCGDLPEWLHAVERLDHDWRGLRWYGLFVVDDKHGGQQSRRRARARIGRDGCCSGKYVGDGDDHRHRAAATQYTRTGFSVSTFATTGFNGAIDGSSASPASGSTCETNPPNYSGTSCDILASVTYSLLASNGVPALSGSAPLDTSSPYSTVFSGTVTVLGNTGTLTLPGYVFAGWCTTDNAADPTGCSGTHYNTNASFTIAANTTLYSQWTAAPSFTVTYSTLTAHGTATATGTAPTDPGSPHLASSTVTVLGNTGTLTFARLRVRRVVHDRHRVRPDRMHGDPVRAGRDLLDLGEHDAVLPVARASARRRHLQRGDGERDRDIDWLSPDRPGLAVPQRLDDHRPRQHRRALAGRVHLRRLVHDGHRLGSDGMHRHALRRERRSRSRRA